MTPNVQIKNFQDFVNWIFGNYQTQIDNATPISWFEKALPFLFMVGLVFLVIKFTK